jgi:hypothetical protein
MYKKIFLALAALPLILTACATARPPVAFHKTDSTTLVIESLDGRNCQMLQPTTTTKEQIDELLQQARFLQQHEAAVVILENYTDPKIGAQFNDRGTEWFVALRGLGYQHICFMQGNGVTNPEGLPTIFEYN